MRRILFAFVFLSSLSLPVPARWVFIPLEALVQDSDLIVVGTLRGVSEHTEGDIDYGQGAIIVDDVLWGNAAPGDLLILKWGNGAGVVYPMLSHKNNENKRGIWLLTVDDGATVSANWRDRFVPLSQTRNVLTALATRNVCARTSHFDTNDPFTVWVVFRNATAEALEFPGMIFLDGTLYLSPSIEITIQDADERKLTASPGRIVTSPDIPTILVESGREHIMRIDLGMLFEFQSDNLYYVLVEIPGFEPANRVRAYQRTPRQR
ncbi:MAG TPA: hypothetical protein VFV34_26865 [Blastocatellia bacterium]|nr:hypothetical protein [Blastocatellia bacterium]